MVELPALTVSTGNLSLDEILRGVIALAEMTFPGWFRACYLEGSFSNQRQVSTSDIDLFFVTNRPIDAVQYELFDRFYECCYRFSRYDLDLNMKYPAQMDMIDTVLLKKGGFFVYGEDMRDELALPPAAEFGRVTLHNGIGFSLRSRANLPIITLPLDYPDPTGEFYGYDYRLLHLPNGQEVASTKGLLVGIGWATTGLIGLKAGQYIARKSDCLTAYRQYINDEWTGFLEDLHRTCRDRWHYLIPSEPAEREELRELLRRALDFENYLLGQYEEILLSDLARLETLSAKEQPYLLRRTGLLGFSSGRVLNSLRLLSPQPDPALQTELEYSLEKLERFYAGQFT